MHVLPGGGGPARGIRRAMGHGEASGLSGSAAGQSPVSGSSSRLAKAGSERRREKCGALDAVVGGGRAVGLDGACSAAQWAMHSAAAACA
jgi:hypothetical protein